MVMYSLPWCITWLVLFFTLSVAIVTLNIVTIIVFIKTRKLRKRSTHLLINLAVADMIVGGFDGTFPFIWVGIQCHFWKNPLTENWSNQRVIIALELLFPICSILNITVISAERLHATFWPFRHRVVKAWLYGLIIASIWFSSMLLSAGLVVMRPSKINTENYFYLWCSFNSTCLLVICVSYACIIVKVRCGGKPQHHGAASRERKLTMTLLIVTVVSLLLWLPFVVSRILLSATDIFSSLSNLAYRQLDTATIVLYHANSLVNPIVYAYRIPEFRRALVALFRKQPQQLNQPAVIPLRDM